MKHSLKLLVVALSLLVLSACSIPRSDLPAQKIYTLQTPQVSPAAGTLPVHLVIRINYTSPVLDSNKIIVMPDVNRYDHIANASWPASMPYYLRDLLLQTFMGSKTFHSIGIAPVSGKLNYALDVQIHNFEALYTAESIAPVCRIRLGAVITRLDVTDGPTDSVFLFEAEQTASENNMPAIIAAFDSSYAQLARQMHTAITQGIQDTLSARP